MSKSFIIFSPGYNDNTGGIVVLHQLCDLLNKENQKAYLWNNYKPIFRKKDFFKSIYLFLRFFFRMVTKGYKTNKKLITPMASYGNLRDSIVIYPEIINGNPLGAKNVVRWLLHKPGFNSAGKINFGKDDLFFFYLKAFDDPRFNKFSDNQLHIENIRSDIYRQTNMKERSGSCYILRKGKNRRIIHDLVDSICIDGLSHEQIAEVFNNVKYCISYDAYTMYSVYAVMCGCISIIVPEEGVTKEQWQPEESDRYGLAYGFDDIEYALATTQDLLKKLKQKEEESKKSVQNFIVKCQKYFDDEY